jgi:hypothetical protein
MSSQSDFPALLSPSETTTGIRGHAVRCLRLAQTIELPETKAMLLEMAQAWVRLAQQARARETEKAIA